MTFKIEKRIGLPFPSERIWAVIADLPGWNRWNPVERDAEGTIAFGGPIAVTETIEGLPARRTAGRVAEWQPNAQLVWTEKRGWLFNVVRYYEIEELEPGSCIVSNGFIFSGFRGEGFHDKHKKAIKTGCEAVAEGLKTAVEAG